MLLDSACQKNFQQLAAKCFLLERKTVARQLLRNRASALPHVTGSQIFQRCPDDSEEIVAAMPIKFCILNRHNCVDEVAGELLVRHCFAILHVDLAEDLAVAIENHTRRFHLFEFVQIERRCLAVEIRGENGNVNRNGNAERDNDAKRNIELRPGIPGRPKAIAWRRFEVCHWHSKSAG